MSGAQRIDLEGVPSLIGRYGQLLAGGPDEHGLQNILSELLSSSGLRTWSMPPIVGASPTIGLSRAGTKVLLGVVWRVAPLTAQDVAEWQQAAQGRNDMEVALLSMSGFDADIASGLDPQGRTVVLLDRKHAEAALCGLMTVDELIEEAGQRAVFTGAAFTPLTALLVRPAAQDPAAFLSHTRRPIPWRLEIDYAAGVSAQHLLSADAGWGEITGLTVCGPKTLLTTVEGVIEVDTLRGTAHWLLPLEGCSGSVLAAADGGVLVRCGAAVVQWKNGELTPIGGDLGDARMLLWGPGGQPWALCGNGPDMAGATLGLVRLGDAAGAQQRYPIAFDANVLGAAWLGDLRFFLGAEGHSAVLDLGITSLVRGEDWIVSPPDPRFLVANGDEVLVAGTGRSGNRAFVHRVDTASRNSELVAEMELTRVHAMGVTPQGRLLLAGDVRGNSQLPHPVIIQVSLPATIPATPSAGQSATSAVDASAVAPAYRAVRAAARGVRKDYALAGRPLKSGGQAQVFPGKHKITDVPVAVKKLHMTGEIQRARLRREVDVGSMFGSNRHVMPVLDFGSTYEWFAMPLAEYSAEDVAADLRDEGALRELITAICDGLREPHQIGWTHRDLKPANILWLDGRWVIADWGLGRRPRGQTTAPGFTRTGGEFGSEGYAAPELYDDAHEAGPEADIYSIGQIIGWALRQTEPRANVPHMPVDGPWRTVVTAATQSDPQQRPATVDALLALIATELDPPSVAAGQGQGPEGEALDADGADDRPLLTEAPDGPHDAQTGHAQPEAAKTLSNAQLLVQRNRAHAARVAADQAAAKTAAAETTAGFAEASSLISELWKELVDEVAAGTSVDIGDTAMRLAFDGVAVEFLRFVDGRFYPAPNLPTLMWVGEIKVQVANAMFGEATVANLVVFRVDDRFEIRLMQFEEETHDPAGSRNMVRLPRALNSHLMPRLYMDEGAAFGGQTVTDEVAAADRVLEIVMQHVQQVRGEADDNPSA